MKLSESSVRETVSLHMPSKSLCISCYHCAALFIILFIQSQSATLSLLTNQSLAVKFKSALSLCRHSAQDVLRIAVSPVWRLCSSFFAASSLLALKCRITSPILWRISIRMVSYCSRQLILLQFSLLCSVEALAEHHCVSWEHTAFLQPQGSSCPSFRSWQSSSPPVILPPWRGEEVAVPAEPVEIQRRRKRSRKVDATRPNRRASSLRPAATAASAGSTSLPHDILLSSMQSLVRSVQAIDSRLQSLEHASASAPSLPHSGLFPLPAVNASAASQPHTGLRCQCC